ncbi:MAG: hypothetical protein ACK59W_21345, partial [Pseudanabaena sp.]
IETTKNVGAIHELPLHFLSHTQLKTAIPISSLLEKPKILLVGCVSVTHHQKPCTQVRAKS